MDTSRWHDAASLIFSGRFRCGALAACVLLAVVGCTEPKTAKSPVADAEPAAKADKTGDSEVRMARAETKVEEPKAEPEQPPAEPAEEKPAAPAEPAPLPAGQAPLPLFETPDDQLTMPTVALTSAHAETCLVKVGDAFPDLKLKDTSGAEKSLGELLGPKLTAVVFWNGSKPTALEELRDVSARLLPRFAAAGVTVVAINVGDEAQLVAEMAKQAGASFPVLCDTDQAAFRQVATRQLPRTYLLDPSGKVLWFDLEYSPTTRRDLTQAIRYSLVATK